MHCRGADRGFAIARCDAQFETTRSKAAQHCLEIGDGNSSFDRRQEELVQGTGQTFNIGPCAGTHPRTCDFGGAPHCQKPARSGLARLRVGSADDQQAIVQIAVPAGRELRRAPVYGSPALRVIHKGPVFIEQDSPDVLGSSVEASRNREHSPSALVTPQYYLRFQMTLPSAWRR